MLFQLELWSMLLGSTQGSPLLGAFQRNCCCLERLAPVPCLCAAVPCRPALCSEKSGGLLKADPLLASIASQLGDRPPSGSGAGR